jgi:hypothetical protein
MKLKYLVAMLFVLSIGYADFNVSSVCIDSNQVMVNTSICDTECYNYSSTSPCDYGCDTTYGRCRTIDAGYGGLVIGVMIFFTVMMFWLSWIFRPQEKFSMETGRTDTPGIFTVILNWAFLLMGLISLWFTVVAVASLGMGYNSGFFEMSVNALNAITSVYGMVIWLFIILFGVFFVLNYFVQAKETIEENLEK